MWKKVDLNKGYWYPKRKLEVATYFSKIIEGQFAKKHHILLCILQPFRIIVALLSLKNAPLHPISFLDSNSPR